MGVVCNGPQKSGTHALREIVISLGFKNKVGGFAFGYRRFKHAAERMPWAEFEKVFGVDEVLSGHDPTLIVRGHVHLRLIRDRRNIAVSWYRAQQKFRKQEATAADFRRWIQSAECHKLHTVLRRFKPWFDENENSDLLHYETLFEEKTVRMIADRCGVVYRPTDAYGRSMTWTGRPSVWREWFDADAMNAFEKSL